MEFFLFEIKYFLLRVLAFILISLSIIKSVSPAAYTSNNVSYFKLNIKNYFFMKNFLKMYYLFKDLNQYGAGFQVVQGQNDDGKPCRDCAITGKCFCLGEKGNRVRRTIH